MEILFIILIFGINLLVIYKISNIPKDNRILADKEAETNKYIQRVRTYFFEDDIFSFEKFCDYIMCIKDDMTTLEYSEILIELDLMIKLSTQLRERLLAVLLYENEILELSYKDFDKMQENLRANNYNDTYKNLTYILITTVLYLKYKTIKSE